MLDQFSPYIIAGIVTGALYGLAATGLVLTYKTSHIFNFAHGAVAALGAYVFFELHVRNHLAWPIALVLTVLVFAPAAGALFELVARVLVECDTPSRIVATIGILLFVQGLTEVIFGAVPLQLHPFISTRTFHLGGVFIGYNQLATLVVSLIGVGALLFFFRTSRLGLEMRAVVDNSELLGLTGTPTARVRRSAWAIGLAFASLSGILLATTIGLNATYLTLLVVQAFGAAAVGRFQNIGITYAAAVAIGIAGQLIQKYAPSHPFLSSLPPSLPFLVLFAVLVLAPTGWFKVIDPRRRPYRPVRLSRRAQLGLGVLCAAIVALVPTLVTTRLPVYTDAAIFVTLFVSLALLTRLSAQVSLCQMTFAAIGATTFAHLTGTWHLPWLPAAVLASLVAVPIGALLSVPAIRLSPLYLGLATFGFAILVQDLLFNTFLMFGGIGDITGSRPHLLGLQGNKGYFYLCAAIAALSIAVAAAVNRSRLGRLLRGLGDSPTALVTAGANVNLTRVIVFCLSAFLAAFAGVLLLGLTGTESAGGTTFAYLESLLLLAVLAISGRSVVLSPLIAAGLLAVVPSYSTSPDVAPYETLIFGIAALAVVLVGPAVSRYLHVAAPASAWRAMTSPVRSRANQGRRLPSLLRPATPPPGSSGP
jgi:branched-subunit amino acid ABC-type transport system permease component